MEANTESDQARAAAEKKAEARRHLIFGAVAAMIIAALIAMMFWIDRYGESKMPNAHLQSPHDAAEEH